tara:strand:+ start:231 stop:803 length:573 start_codon:yes stop_codon:yes gene_type:complete
MNRTSIIILGVSALFLVGAAVTFAWGVSKAASIDVDDNAIFQGKQGTVEIEKYSSYSVYVKSDYSCSETTVSIYDDEWEYFFEDCDRIMNEDGWNMVGYFSPDICCQLNVDANHEIAIVDDMVFVREGGGHIIISGGLCCLGVIGVIVGIIVIVTSKPDENRVQIINSEETPPIVEESDNTEKNSEWWSE